MTKQNILRPNTPTEKGVKVGKYTYYKSSKPDKKLMVIVDGKKIHFGSSAMQHYKDRTGIWKSKDHGDSKRRENYKNRASGIKGKDGKLTYTDETKANYHAYHILW
jgi:hypothetical protein